jgi:hypothetical protein
MFGYVTINKPEMMVKEYEEYRSYYCGLCTALRNRYKTLGRISLSYDMTFLYLLLSSLYEPETQELQERCAAHPFEKHTAKLNPIADYVADMNVLLTFYKCQDDWADERRLVRKLYGLILRKRSSKQRKLYREKILRIRQLLSDLEQKEKENCLDPDVMSGLFGQILAQVFVYRQDAWSDNLERMGFFLGKFIYLVDAYEDAPGDMKHGRYNPIAHRMDNPSFELDSRTALTMVMAECCKEFEQLPIIENVDILRNILYSGVWTRYEAVQKAREKAAGKKQGDTK